MAGFWRTFLNGWLGVRTKAREEVGKILEYEDRVLAPSTDASWNSRGYLAIGCMALNVDRTDMARRCFSESFRYVLTVFPRDSAWFFARLKSQNAIADLRMGDIRSAELNVARATSSSVATKEPSPRSSNCEAELLEAKAELLVAKGELDSVIVLLSRPISVQYALSGSSFLQLMATNILLRRDVLARAYVKKGDIDAAIREYERITTFDPLIPDRRLIHPLDRYELAKLYEKNGIKEKAVTQYEKFLFLWKNADRDRPEPRDARARLARLKSKT
jgi:tetratricopeptide (TPR) repeat protein